MKSNASEPTRLPLSYFESTADKSRMYRAIY
jgi:hypothetical protein